MIEEEKHIVLKRTWYDWILEILSWGSLLYGLLPLWLYSKIPETAKIPISWMMNGEVRKWGDKKTILIIVFLTIGIFLLLLFLERNYKSLNYPVKITEQNRIPLFREGVRLARELRFLGTFFGAFLANMICYTALENPIPNSHYILILIVIALFVSTVYHIFKMYKER
ncbi:MAG: hypothetical protein IKH69_03885 [Bacteroidaceae bacterium]|jgi:hypothetical protein|nr:hypothetical protein [Bacteroidaceae bacterium]